MRELEDCRSRCSELERRSKSAEERCEFLELEIEKKNSQLKSLQLENLATENEIRVLKQKKEEEPEEEKLLDLMIENRVLNCEKQKAESEVEIWKVKYRELESRVSRLEESLVLMEGQNAVAKTINVEAETLQNGTPFTHSPRPDGEKVQNKFGRCSRIRRKLTLGQDIPNKNMAPPTPGSAPTRATIDISDSDDDHVQKNQPASSTSLKRTTTLLNQDDEENFQIASTSKRRKRASNIIKSDSESSDDDDHDDDVPISVAMKKRKEKLDPNFDLNAANDDSGDEVSERVRGRRRLISSRYIEENDSNIEGEDESMGGFIVADDDDHYDDGDGDDDDEDLSDGHVDYDKIMSEIGRKREKRSKWEYEGELLADFGKDTELCMRAVCALFRQQTADEQCCKGTIYTNNRGFSQVDALRGSELAVFLTGGDPNCDLIKTVEELQEHDWNGPELCRTLATNYSKQLFQIYKNKEDPFFLAP